MEKNEKGETKPFKSKCEKFFFDWIIPITIAIVVAISINKFLIFKVEIPSESMVPTLNVNDQLFASRVYNVDNLKRGDIVIFNFTPEDKLYIKRLIGLPGDEVEVKAGKVWINGEEIQEDYVKNPESTDEIYNVPEGKFLFFGDNRARSYDARKWKVNGERMSYIDSSQIKGKALFKVYPFSDFGTID